MGLSLIQQGFYYALLKFRVSVYAIHTSSQSLLSLRSSLITLKKMVFYLMKVYLIMVVVVRIKVDNREWFAY